MDESIRGSDGVEYSRRMGGIEYSGDDPVIIDIIKVIEKHSTVNIGGVQTIPALSILAGSLILLLGVLRSMPTKLFDDNVEYIIAKIRDAKTIPAKHAFIQEADEEAKPS